MAERVPVLKHHKEVIDMYWSGITDSHLAIQVLREEMLPEVRAEKFLDGAPSYPNMNEDELVRQFSKLIVAVNTDQADILPEWDNKGRKNFDGVCGPCGNLVSSVNVPGATMCGRLKRIVEFQKKINR